MRTIKITLLYFLILFSAKGQVLLKISGDSLMAYEYNGGDEFNAPALNDSYWQNGFGGRRVLMSQDLSFSKKNVAQEKGLVNFFAKKEDSLYTLFPYEIDSQVIKREKLKLNNNQFQTKYSAGGILSRSKFHYGLYELRFKVEEGQGVWPAFWFQVGYKNEEIDGFELKGEKNNKIHVDTHCPSGCDAGYKNRLGINTSFGGWLPVSGYLHEGFNIFLVEWKENEIFWYINGYPLAYFKGTLPNPLKVFINTSVAKNGGPFKPGPDEKTTWPNTFSVDYFRAWKSSNGQEALKLGVNSDCKVSDKFQSTYNIKPKGSTSFMSKRSKLNKEEGYISITRPDVNLLRITTLGKLNNPKTQISISYLKSNKTHTLVLTGTEVEIPIEAGESEILINIDVKGKPLSKKIILSN